MIKLSNFEFIFAIKGPKLAMRIVQGKFVEYKIGGFLFYLYPWNDWEGQARGPIHPNCLIGDLVGNTQFLIEFP